MRRLSAGISPLSSNACLSYRGAGAPKILGIDEHFFSRKQGYATTLVDLKNHKVFDVVLGRSEASLRSFLRRLPGKEQVRVIVIDMNGFLVQKSIRAKQVKTLLPQLLRLLEQFAHSPARALASTQQSWLEPIVRMWRFSRSNGITEGLPH